MEALIRQVSRLNIQQIHHHPLKQQIRLYSSNFTLSPFGVGPVNPENKIKKGFVNHHPVETKKPLQTLTRLRCVDNSAIGKQTMAEGRAPKIIHIYSRTKKGTLGDKVLMTMKGEMKKGIVVGVRKRQKPFIPRFDTNNVVLVDDAGTPLGTRIHVPIPIQLRAMLKTKQHYEGNRVDYSKLIAIATRFV